MRRSMISLAAAVLLASGACSWPPGAPATPALPQPPAEQIENRDPNDVPTMRLPEPPPAELPETPGGVL